MPRRPVELETGVEIEERLPRLVNRLPPEELEFAEDMLPRLVVGDIPVDSRLERLVVDSDRLAIDDRPLLDERRAVEIDRGLETLDITAWLVDVLAVETCEPPADRLLVE